MLRFRLERGWRLVTQPAHAWMAGTLAAAWGGALPPPEPRDAVLVATRLHDIGWDDLDAAPRLNDDGEPAGFLQTTAAETIAVWERAVDTVGLISPYAALLVSRHAALIFQRRIDRGGDSPADRAQLARAATAHEARRAALRHLLAGRAAYGAHLSPEALAAAYRWLRACDRLSLAVLTDDVPAAGTIEGLPASRPGESVTLAYRRRGPVTLAVDPWPFRAPRLALAVDARMVPQQQFADSASWERAIAAAPWQHVAIRVEPDAPA